MASSILAHAALLSIGASKFKARYKNFSEFEKMLLKMLSAKYQSFHSSLNELMEGVGPSAKVSIVWGSLILFYYASSDPDPWIIVVMSVD